MVPVCRKVRMRGKLSSMLVPTFLIVCNLCDYNYRGEFGYLDGYNFYVSDLDSEMKMNSLMMKACVVKEQEYIYIWNNMLDGRKWDIRLNPPHRFAILVLDETGGCCSRTGNISSPGLGKRRGVLVEA